MNHLVIPLGKIKREHLAKAGGKGAALALIAQKSVPFADGFVILSTAFDMFLEISGLKGKISKLQEKIDSKNEAEFYAISRRIALQVLRAKMPDSLSASILEAFAKLNAPLAAIRSSATAEDSVAASWAGEFDTYLNTSRPSLIENIQKCWASLFNSRSIHYSIHNRVALSDLSMAVVVQKMIQPDVSGVCFTINQFLKQRNHIMIEAGFGLGKAVVEGLITPDAYTVDRKKLKIVDKTIACQSFSLKSLNHATVKRTVPKNMQNKQKLSDKNIVRLSELCLAVESIFKTPQDIEWACQKRTIYILQSRPIKKIAV
jgi:phosphoenolpyruvate synthase/pyruvate phosphate dikinase